MRRIRILFKGGGYTEIHFFTISVNPVKGYEYIRFLLDDGRESGFYNLNDVKAIEFL